MEILIIGNGFDLAHNLPTQYADFLHVCDLVKTVGVDLSWGSRFPMPGVADQSDQELLCYFVSKIGKNRYLEFEELVRHNFWIDYFQEEKEYIGEKWLDFEEAIKEVIVQLSLIKTLTKNEVTALTERKIKQIYNLLNGYPELKGDSGPNGLIYNLFEQHKRMVRAFEIYIDGYVNKTECSRNQLFEKKYDHVLSFNYSDTYKNLYDSAADCCFIHGKADVNRNTSESNIVLGIESAFEDHDNVGKEVLPFEKYVQRIVKRTDSSYLEWLDVAFDGECNVHIFGHSFGSSDADVLKYFIDNENERVKQVVKTYIYCRDDEDRAEKIINLAVILGRDKLVKMTSGRRQSIRFIVPDKGNMEEMDDGSGIKDT